MGATQPLAGTRILILFPHLVVPGGALNYTLHLTELLLERDATVAILTLRAEPGQITLPPGVEVLSLNGPLTSSLRYWLLLPYWQAKINRRLRLWKPDVLVPQVFPSNWWGWLYRRVHPETPLVWVCHEPSAFIHSKAWIRALNPWWKSFMAQLLRPVLALIDRHLARFADRIVANSRSTAQMVTKIYSRKVDAIAYPGIDFSVFQPDNPPAKDPVLITVCRLTRFKRIDFLLRVFVLLRKRRPDLRLIVVGEGEEEKTLRRMAEELDIASSVTFSGKVVEKDLAALYRRSLAFLHGSVEEPFGMAPLEAIACGTPVIAHRSGGPMEFVTSVCGLLIDSLVEERWAQEVEDFLSRNNADRSYFGQVASCARRFAWEESLNPLLAIVGEAAARRSEK